METENNCSQYYPNWQDKIAYKLFPSKHDDAPEMEGSHDCIHIHTKSELSILDRIRILISGRVIVITKTATENVVGKCLTGSTFIVDRPKFLERKE